MIFEEPEELLLLDADPQLIIQVLVNLLSNAYRYTPPDSQIRITAQKEGEFARITVADDGPGIPENELEKIFEAFYTGEEKRQDGRRGLGLGLSLCRSIIEAHGGSMRAENAEPHGAVFTFTLPLQEVAADE